MNQPRSRLATLISAGLACLLAVPAAAQSRYTTPTTPGLEGKFP